MNIIALMKLPAAVPNPPTGYAAIFINATTLAPNAKFPDGTVSTIQGPQGLKGDTGAAATINIGTVTPLLAGSTPTVSNSGTPGAVTLNFGLPVSSLIRKSVAISFTDQDLSQQITVTDALVTSVNFPTGFSIFTNCLEADDYQYVYTVSLSSVSVGSFTVNISVSDVDGDSVSGLPLPDVMLQYLI